TGRDPSAANLLANSAASLAMLAICYMEAFSAFENERGRRNRFRGQLEEQIVQLKRDSTSPHARLLLAHLEESRLENDLLLNDVQVRLFQAMETVRTATDMIALT